MATSSLTESTGSAALRLLARWIPFARQDWYPIPGSPDLGCYGTGYDHWGVQASQKYVAAAADWATYDTTAAAADREEAMQRALAAFRHTLLTHKTGDRTGTDGTQWGRTWISGLGIERMAHAVPLLRPRLTSAEWERYVNLLTDEAHWLLTSYHKGDRRGVSGTKWNHEGGNAPESNVWNGAVLWRAAVHRPDHPEADAWREQAHLFLINGVSIPADAADATAVAGQPVSARHRGPNFFPNYGLDHHGYLNVGYMVITLSNVAMLQADMQAEGQPYPESLQHHAADLWRVLRRFVFGDGRLARIGGDTRLRYTYCQEYLVPVLLHAARHWNDTQAPHLLERQLRLIEEEAVTNADGSFYGTRLEELRATQPYYYTRLESDRAAVLGQLAHYLNTLPPLRTAPAAEPFESSVGGSWAEPEHGAVMHRSPTRLASYAWRACGLGQGLCQPPADGHLAEWSHNLTGRVRFLGEEPQGTQHRRLVCQRVQLFDGGFATIGTIREGCRLTIPEGYRRDEGCADHQIAVVALPDGHTMVGLHHCRTDSLRTFVTEAWALHLNLPNDLYNGFRRTLHWAGGRRRLTAPARRPEAVCLPTIWAWTPSGDSAAEGLGFFGIYGDECLRVQRSPQRRAGPYPSLFIEEIGWGGSPALRSYDPNSLVLDAAWAVVSSCTAAAAGVAAGQAMKLPADGDMRLVQVVGQDRVTYLIAAHFGTRPSPAPDRCRSGGTALLATAETLAPGAIGVWAS